MELLDIDVVINRISGFALHLFDHKHFISRFGASEFKMYLNRLLKSYMPALPKSGSSSYTPHLMVHGSTARYILYHESRTSKIDYLDSEREKTKIIPKAREPEDLTFEGNFLYLIRLKILNYIEVSPRYLPISRKRCQFRS